MAKRGREDIAAFNAGGYFSLMTCTRTFVLLAFGLIAGCGGGGSQLGTAGFPSLPADVQIAGNLHVDDGDPGSLLVFGYVDLTPGGTMATEEPTSVASVRDDGRFELSTPPGHKFGVAFLADDAHDGALDVGDALAVLLDPEEKLRDLAAGDRVELVDVQVSFGSGQAAAASIVVVRAAPAATPTAAAE